jgi:CheY-like chemotaxis protein
MKEMLLRALHAMVEPSHCAILIVDDDPGCLEEYAEIIDRLGYPCLRATSAHDALQLIGNTPEIGIVVSDFQMPAMDGLSFLNELATRFSASRPLVSIMATAFASLDTAVQAMQSNAVDFLAKPVSHDSFAAALRRASARWNQLAGQQRLATFFNAISVGESVEPATPQRPVPTQQDLLEYARMVIRSRRLRGEFLDRELFCDPSWDILLELTTAQLEGKDVPVTSACVAANAPFTTAHRYLNSLASAGLIRRRKDPSDQRRVLVELNEAAFSAMTAYLRAMILRQWADRPLTMS